MKLFTLVFGLLMLSFNICAQDALSLGKIIDRVAIEADKTQSYSLYLPSRFDGKTKLPIIYVFDPGARGSVAVKVFADAAEKYGYIVVGSNDSRNGLSVDKLMPIFNNISDDTHRRFPIDDGRIVMAGFSGGARVASIFAYSCKCAFAVIGGGAGFWQNIEVSNKLPFVFFGTAGYDDLNYFELRSLSEKLAAASVPHRVDYFDGPHQWMPPSMAETAIAWVELQAMRANRKPKEDALIERSLKQQMDTANALLAARKYIEAEAAFRSIAMDFAGFRDTSAANEKLKVVASSPELKKALKAERDEAAEYERRSGEIFGYAQQLNDLEQRQATLSQIRNAGEAVRSSAESKEDSASRRTARRLLDGIFIGSVETASAAVRSGTRLTDGLNILELADAMRPRNAYVSYLRAQLLALDGQKKKAVEALSKAVEFGLKDRARVENERAFEGLRSDPEFQVLLSKM
jgi:hypothetical protein